MPRSRPGTRRTDDFFRLLPRRSVVVFFLAVFFTFAPIGLMMASSLAERRPLRSILISFLVSGCLAVSWAATYTVSRWFIAGIVLFSILMILIFGPLSRSVLGVSGRPSLEGLSFVAAIVIGYILFIVFISGQGRTTLRLKTEMDLAGQIHEALVPAIRTSDDRYEALGVSVASSEMGGDLVDLVHHQGGTDLVLADVSGHGVRAGVVMAMVKSGLRTGLQVPSGLGEILTRLNRLLDECTTSEIYTTFAGLRLPDGGDREIEFALAGHRLLHVHAASGEIEKLDSQHMPLGMLPQSCGSRRLVMEPGDLLAAYTDGLSETEDAAGRQLGDGPIEQVILEKARSSLEEIQEAVFSLADSHGAQTDDRSLLLVRAHPEAGGGHLAA